MFSGNDRNSLQRHFMVSYGIQEQHSWRTWGLHLCHHNSWYTHSLMRQGRWSSP